MNAVRIYDYLVLCRERIFDAVHPLTAEQWNHEFPVGMKKIGTTLTHLYTAEWYYIERLERREVPPYAIWPVKEEHPPASGVLENLWREQQKRIRGVIAAEHQKNNWGRKITWLSFPDDTRDMKRFQITCTAGDLFTQLALHEMHHRAQVMAMLRQLGAAIVEDIDYNALMYERVDV